MGKLESWLPSLIIGFLVVELYLWLPRIGAWILERCVKRLPEALQDRYREEWEASFSDLPNSIIKFVHIASLHCRGSPGAIAGSYFSENLARAATEIDRLRHETKSNAGVINKAIDQWMATSASRSELSPAVAKSMAKINDGSSYPPEIRTVLAELSVATSEFVDTLQRVLERSSGLLGKALHEAHEAFGRTRCELDLAEDFYRRATRFAAAKPLPVAELEASLKGLDDALWRARQAAEWHWDEIEAAECRRIGRATNHAVKNLTGTLRLSGSEPSV